MPVVRCPHGHYYDDQKFSSCPHCGITVGMGGGAESTPAQKRQPEKERSRGLFGWLDRDKTVALSHFQQEEEARGDSKTISLEAAQAAEDDDQRTVGFYSGARGNDYVTGWLVCTAGPEKGRDYRLHHGFNRIGRDVGMDVQVLDDPAISRKNHASVVYDEKSNRFSLVPSVGTLTYYHNDLLTKTETIQAGDEIKMGNSTFVFIPFCMEGRVWQREEES